MRVLFVGHRNPDFPTVTDFLQQAFLVGGHDVLFIEYRDYILPGRSIPSFPPAKRFEAWRLGNRVINATRRFNPDLLFVNYGEWLPLGALRRTKQESGALSVVWFTDFPGSSTYRNRVLEVAPHYDLVAVQSRDMATVLEQSAGIRSFWLPAAADPSIHFPLDIPVKNEVWFIGSWYPRREELLQALDGYPLHVAGPGWENASHLKGASIHPGGQKPETIREVCSSAAINLSIHLCEGWGRVEFTQAGPRVFEILACRGFMLSDRVGDLDELLTEGTHYAGFCSTGELRERVDYYLRQPEERERIAQSGFECVLSQHTYEERVRNLMEAVSERIRA